MVLLAGGAALDRAVDDVLRVVRGREVTLQNDRDTAVLTLPRPDGA